MQYKESGPMAIPEQIRKLWMEIQKKHSVPVNAIGVKIESRDVATLKVWREQGLDQFLKK